MAGRVTPRRAWGIGRVLLESRSARARGAHTRMLGKWCAVKRSGLNRSNGGKRWQWMGCKGMEWVGRGWMGRGRKGIGGKRSEVGLLGTTLSELECNAAKWSEVSCDEPKRSEAHRNAAQRRAAKRTATQPGTARRINADCA